MCIAIVKPAGQWAPKADLRKSFDSNPHGAGYAFFKDGAVVIKKGFFKFEEFFDSYIKDVSASMPALLHFRIATLGSKNEANCHPYYVPGEDVVEGDVSTATSYGVLMHNGPCLNRKHCGGDKEGDRSDSRQFAEDYIGKLMQMGMTKEMLCSAPMRNMIEEFIGYEKVVLMFNDGSVQIYNEGQGHWEHGCWWSNHSHKTYESRYTGSYSGVYGGATGAAGSGTTKSPGYDSRVRDTIGYSDDNWDDDGGYVGWWDRQYDSRSPKQEPDKKDEEKASEVAPQTIESTAKNRKFKCIWSIYLKEYVPEHVKLIGQIGGEAEEYILEWDDDLGGYAALERSGDAFADPVSREILDFEEDGDEMIVIGKTIDTVDELRAFLAKVEGLDDIDLKFVDEFYRGFLDEDEAGTEQEAAQQEVVESAGDKKELAVIEPNSGVKA